MECMNIVQYYQQEATTLVKCKLHITDPYLNAYDIVLTFMEILSKDNP